MMEVRIKIYSAAILDGIAKKFSSDLLGTSSIRICLSTHACNGAALREDSHSLIVIHHYSLQK